MPAADRHSDLRPSAPTTRRVLRRVPSARRSSAAAGSDVERVGGGFENRDRVALGGLAAQCLREDHVRDVAAESVEPDLGGGEYNLWCPQQRAHVVDDADRENRLGRGAAVLPSAEAAQEAERAGKKRRRAGVGRAGFGGHNRYSDALPRDAECCRQPRRAGSDDHNLVLNIIFHDSSGGAFHPQL